jgi:hypothetical protein
MTVNSYYFPECDAVWSGSSPSFRTASILRAEEKTNQETNKNVAPTSTAADRRFLRNVVPVHKIILQFYITLPSDMSDICVQTQTLSEMRLSTGCVQTVEPNVTADSGAVSFVLSAWCIKQPLTRDSNVKSPMQPSRLSAANNGVRVVLVLWADEKLILFLILEAVYFPPYLPETILISI